MLELTTCVPIFSMELITTAKPIFAYCYGLTKRFKPLGVTVELTNKYLLITPNSN